MSDERQWQDYIAIRNLIGRLNAYADAADGKNYSEFYLEDGVFEIAGHGTHVGRLPLHGCFGVRKFRVTVVVAPE